MFWSAITNSSFAFNICMKAGTHGKTTTSTMVAHILPAQRFWLQCVFGGIAVSDSNFNSNFWSHKRNVCVVEADELTGPVFETES